MEVIAEISMMERGFACWANFLGTRFCELEDANPLAFVKNIFINILDRLGLSHLGVGGYRSRLLNICEGRVFNTMMSYQDIERMQSSIIRSVDRPSKSNLMNPIGSNWRTFCPSDHGV